MAAPPPPPKAFSLAQLAREPGVWQVVKFGIVGASGMVINLTVLYVMLRLVHGRWYDRYIDVTVAFLFSVTNGYYWNRRWTFQSAPAKAIHKQFTQFLLISTAALGLDLLVIWLLSVPFEHQIHALQASWPAPKVEQVAVIAAQLAAAGVGGLWNFCANRFWTFKN